MRACGVVQGFRFAAHRFRLRGESMFWHQIRFIGLFLALSVVANAQESYFQDELLDRLTGNWILTGQIAGDEVVHTIDARWVLGHQYLLFDERTEKGEIDYEATVIIGWDEPSSRYVCLWLDSTGGGGLSNGILGYAERSNDEIAFIFGDGANRFHTTFTYDRANDTWRWTMDSEKAGQFTPFARLTMKRKS